MEICTTGPGFQLDEKLEDLGDRLCLSPRVEPLRAKLEAELTPIVNPRPRSKAKASAPPSNGVPRRSPRPSPDVTLTFDNGPDPEATPRVLDVLRRARAEGDVLRRRASSCARTARSPSARVAEGHWIGNHTLTHPRPLGAGRRARARRSRPPRRELGALGAPGPALPPVGRGRRPRAGPAQPARRRHARRRRLHLRALERGPGRLGGRGGWVERALRQIAARDWTLLVLHDVAGACADRLEEFLDRADGDVPPGLPARLRADPRRRRSSAAWTGCSRPEAVGADAHRELVGELSGEVWLAVAPASLIFQILARLNTPRLSQSGAFLPKEFL